MEKYEIQARIAMARAAVALLEQEPEGEQRDDALNEYRAQVAELEKMAQVATPEPIVIGLKTAQLFARKGA